MQSTSFQLVGLLNTVLDLLILTIIARAVISWFRPNPSNFFVQLIDKITDPVMKPIERIVPPVGGMDFSPLIAVFILHLIQGILPSLLLG